MIGDKIFEWGFSGKEKVGNHEDEDSIRLRIQRIKNS
jgi:hypothetical protein